MKETGRRRREDEPTNTKCKECNKDVWQRVSVHTIHHGKGYYDLKDKLQSCVHIQKGILCPECFAIHKDQQTEDKKC